MLHLWLVDDLEYVADVHAPMHPCIQSGGAIFDMDHPCHDEWQGSSARRPRRGARPPLSPAPGAGAALQLQRAEVGRARHDLDPRAVGVGAGTSS